MASYKIFFVFECSPETHWGIENEDQVNIYGEKSYLDGEESFDSDGEETKISNWEDCVDDITARWEHDSLFELDYIDDKKNEIYVRQSASVNIVRIIIFRFAFRMFGFGVLDFEGCRFRGL